MVLHTRTSLSCQQAVVLRDTTWDRASRRRARSAQRGLRPNPAHDHDPFPLGAQLQGALRPARARVDRGHRRQALASRPHRSSGTPKPMHRTSLGCHRVPQFGGADGGGVRGAPTAKASRGSGACPGDRSAVGRHRSPAGAAACSWDQAVPFGSPWFMVRST